MTCSDNLHNVQTMYGVLTTYMIYVTFVLLLKQYTKEVNGSNIASSIGCSKLLVQLNHIRSENCSEKC